jgi:hypothetical protein
MLILIQFQKMLTFLLVWQLEKKNFEYGIKLFYVPLLKNLPVNNFFHFHFYFFTFFFTKKTRKLFLYLFFNLNK